MLFPSPDVQHLQDPDGSLYAHADELKGYLQTALQAANRLDHPETYQQTIQDFLDQLDHIVGETFECVCVCVCVCVTVCVCVCVCVCV